MADLQDQVNTLTKTVELLMQALDNTLQAVKRLSSEMDLASKYFEVSATMIDALRLVLQQKFPDFDELYAKAEADSREFQEALREIVQSVDMENLAAGFGESDDISALLAELLSV